MTSKLYGVASVLAGLLLIINTSCLAASANDGGQFRSLRLVGNVFCDTCFREKFSASSYFISGASVAVQCIINAQAKPDFRLEAKTNEYGEFKFELPASIFHSHEQVKRCSATLLKNPRGSCKVASMAKSSSFSLKSKQGGIYTYSAGSFTYRPPSPPPLCSKDASQTATLSSVKKGRFPKSGLKVSSASVSSSKPSQLPPLLPPPSLLPPLPTIPPFPPLPLPLPTPSSPPPVLPPPSSPFPTIPPFPFPLPPFLTPSPPPPSPLLPLPTFPPLPITLPPLPFLSPPPPAPLFNLPPLLPFPPNPFQPPAPLIPLPPNPFQPPAPLIPLPPNPFQPPASLIPLPPNPLLPPPLIPLVPNPLQPAPLIPLPPNPLLPPPLIPLVPNPLQPAPLIPLPPNPLIPPAQHTLPTTP